jgi:hypothetical protein
MLQLVTPSHEADAFMLIHVLPYVSTCVGLFKIILCDTPWGNQLAVISLMARNRMRNFKALKKGQF